MRGRETVRLFTPCPSQLQSAPPCFLFLKRYEHPTGLYRHHAGERFTLSSGERAEGTAVESRLECTFSMHSIAPRGTSGERGNPIKPSSVPRPTIIGLTHSLCRCASSAPNRPSAYAAEKIRDVGDNVPPRWEGCCPQRLTIFLRDARTNNSSSFVGTEGGDRFRFRRQFP